MLVRYYNLDGDICKTTHMRGRDPFYVSTIGTNRTNGKCALLMVNCPLRSVKHLTWEGGPYYYSYYTLLLIALFTDGKYGL